MGKPDEAAPIFKQAETSKQEERDRERAVISLNQGIDLLRSGEVEKAIESFESALKIQENFPEAHYYLGIARAERKDFDKAVEEFRTALEERPRDPEMRFNFAIALWRQGKVSEAIEEFRSVIKQKPDDGEAYCYLAHLLLGQGQTIEGKKLLQRAQQLGRCSTRGH